MSLEEFSKDFQGETLFCRHVKPENGEPRALLCIVHGYGDHIGRYEEFSQRLSKLGVFIFTHDLSKEISPFFVCFYFSNNC